VRNQMVGFDDDLSVRDQWVRTGAVVKAFLSVSKAKRHSSVKCHKIPLRVRHVSGTVIQE